MCTTGLQQAPKGVFESIIDLSAMRRNLEAFVRFSHVASVNEIGYMLLVIVVTECCRLSPDMCSGLWLGVVVQVLQDLEPYLDGSLPCTRHLDLGESVIGVVNII